MGSSHSFPRPWGRPCRRVSQRPSTRSPRMSPRPLGPRDAVFTVLLGLVCHIKVGAGVTEKEGGHLPSSQDKLSGSSPLPVPRPWGPVEVAAVVPAPSVWRPRGPQLPAEVRPSMSTLRAAPRTPPHSPGDRSRRRPCQVGRLQGRLSRPRPARWALAGIRPLLNVSAGVSKCKCKAGPSPGPGRGPGRGQGPGPGQRLGPVSVLGPP